MVRRAWADAAYRERLLDDRMAPFRDLEPAALVDLGPAVGPFAGDPKAALAELLGVELPDRLEVKVVEERSDLLCIVLPVDVSAIPPETCRVMTGRRPPPGRVY